MCGRFVADNDVASIVAHFDVDRHTEALLDPSYNVAPTDDVYAVTQAGDERVLDVYHWGLVPRWAKDPSVGNRMINARSETAATSGAFKQALARRRCIVPAAGFYEWTPAPQKGAKKQPHFIHRRDRSPLAMAGLWESWKSGNSDDDLLFSFTLLTTEANDTMAPLHDRMPVLLLESDWDRWLDPKMRDTEALQDLLVPAANSLLMHHPVSTEVNNVRNNDPSFPDRIEVETAEPTLPGF